MARCAVCRLSDGVVLNIIIASDGDKPPIADCQLIVVPDDIPCGPDYIWNGETFIDPAPIQEGSLNGD